MLGYIQSVDWTGGLEYWTGLLECRIWRSSGSRLGGRRSRACAFSTDVHAVGMAEPEEMDVTGSTGPEGSAERPKVIDDDHLVPVCVRMQCSS